MKKSTLLITGSILTVLLFTGCSSEKTPESVSTSEVEATASKMATETDAAELEAKGKSELAEAEAKAAELSKKAEEESKKKLSELGK